MKPILVQLLTSCGGASLAFVLFAGLLDVHESSTLSEAQRLNGRAMDFLQTTRTLFQTDRWTFRQELTSLAERQDALSAQLVSLAAQQAHQECHTLVALKWPSITCQNAIDAERDALTTP